MEGGKQREIHKEKRDDSRMALPKSRKSEREFLAASSKLPQKILERRLAKKALQNEVPFFAPNCPKNSLKPPQSDSYKNAFF